MRVFLLICGAGSWSAFIVFLALAFTHQLGK
jgi:hypothetical protein